MIRHRINALFAASAVLFLLLFAGCSAKKAPADKETQPDTAAGITTTVATVTTAEPTAAAAPAGWTPEMLPQTFAGDLQALRDAIVCFTPGEYTVQFNTGEKFKNDELIPQYFRLLDPDGAAFQSCILGTELADLDGDGQEELLVLSVQLNTDMDALGFSFFYEGIDADGSYYDEPVPDRLSVYGLTVYEAVDGRAERAADLFPVIIDTKSEYWVEEEYRGKFPLKCPLPFISRDYAFTSVYTAPAESGRLIVAESYEQMFQADGVECFCAVWAYRNQSFVSLTGAYATGSCFYEEPFNRNLPAYIPGYSFPDAYFAETDIAYFSYQFFPADARTVLFSANPTVNMGALYDQFQTRDENNESIDVDVAIPYKLTANQ